jgi:hypothetical protein
MPPTSMPVRFVSSATSGIPESPPIVITMARNVVPRAPSARADLYAGSPRLDQAHCFLQKRAPRKKDEPKEKTAYCAGDWPWNCSPN